MSIFFLSGIFQDHVVDRHSSCIPSSYYGYYCCVLGDQETKAFFQVENVIGFNVLLALSCSFPTLCQVGNVIGFVVLLALLCSFPTLCQVGNVIGFVVLLALLCSFPTLCQVGNVIGFVVLLTLFCSFPTFCQVENVIGFIVLRCCSFVLPQLYRTLKSIKN